MDGAWLVIVFCSYFEIVLSFPSGVIQSEPETFSHSKMTLEGIFQTTSKFVVAYGLRNKTLDVSQQIPDYFGTGISTHNFCHVMQSVWFKCKYSAD